jgi:hypothetical protein
MRILVLVLLLSFLAVTTVPERAMSQESKTLQATPGQRTIRDPAEYKAYMSALHLTSPAEKGAAMEKFAEHYPHSVIYADALQEAMAAYQVAGNGAKVAEVAGRLLKSQPKHIQALAILAFIKMNSGSPAAVAEGKGYAERGLKLLPDWKGVAGMSAEQFAPMRQETAAIFYNAIGLADLYAKDYPAARRVLLKSVAIDLNGFVDPYRLAVAELEMTPLDPQGFWYIAKSIDLAKRKSPDAAAKIEPYAAAKYNKYHGGMDGWDALLAAAAKQDAPPKGFAVQPAH